MQTLGQDSVPVMVFMRLESFLKGLVQGSVPGMVQGLVL